MHKQNRRARLRISAWFPRAGILCYVWIVRGASSDYYPPESAISVGRST